MGFGRADPDELPPGVDEAIEEALGSALVRQVDVVVARIARSDEARRTWVEGHLLPSLARRWLDEGVRLEWDESLVRWILDRPEGGGDGRGWERLIEDHLAPAILERLRSRAPGTASTASLRLSFRSGALRVDPVAAH
jgi:hypothetical protein